VPRCLFITRLRCTTQPACCRPFRRYNRYRCDELHQIDRHDRCDRCFRSGRRRKMSMTGVRTENRVFLPATLLMGPLQVHWGEREGGESVDSRFGTELPAAKSRHAIRGSLPPKASGWPIDGGHLGSLTGSPVPSVFLASTSPFGHVDDGGGHWASIPGRSKLRSDPPLTGLVCIGPERDGALDHFLGQLVRSRGLLAIRVVGRRGFLLAGRFMVSPAHELQLSTIVCQREDIPARDRSAF